MCQYLYATSKILPVFKNPPIQMKMTKIVVLFTSFLFCAVAHSAEITTVPALYQQIEQEHIADGVVEAIKQATMSAQTAGQVLEVNFDVDDYVKKGSVLARFKGTEQKAELGQAQAQVTEAQSRLKESQIEFNRVKQAYEKQAVAAVAMDKAAADLNTAKARLDAAVANLNRHSEKVEYTMIKAPYSGVVLQRHIEPGEMAFIGQPIMTGFALDELRVVATIPQNQINAIRQRKKARILIGDETFTAKNVTIIPRADAQGHTFKVRVDFPPDVEGIYPGMFAKVIFSIGETAQRLLIPAQAVAYRGEVCSVYVIDDKGKISMRQIRLGSKRGDSIEVLAGLEANEKIATNPIDAVIVLKTQRNEKKP